VAGPRRGFFAVDEHRQTVRDIGEGPRLRVQLRRRGRALFGYRSFPLGNLIEGCYVSADLREAFGLFGDATVNLIYQLVDFGGIDADGSSSFGQQIRLGHPVGRSGDGFLDRGCGVAGGRRATLCQIPDFIRHNREPKASFAGAGSFHRGVESQDVGSSSITLAIS
jgi:hypothetical protein